MANQETSTGQGREAPRSEAPREVQRVPQAGVSQVTSLRSRGNMLIAAVLGTALSAIGCADDQAVFVPVESTSDGGAGAGAAGGAGGTGGLDGHAGNAGTGGSGGAVECNEPERLCDGECANILEDSANCGDCGQECEMPLAVCMNGECTAGCDDGFADCYDYCTETSSNPGECTHVCTDETTEPNCGGCGVTCPGTTTCQEDPQAPGDYKCQQ